MEEHIISFMPLAVTIQIPAYLLVGMANSIQSLEV